MEPSAGVIILLLWIYLANLALFFGAEFDSETERGRQLQGGIEAEHTLQLPPRDDAKTRNGSSRMRRPSRLAANPRPNHDDAAARLARQRSPAVSGRRALSAAV